MSSVPDENRCRLEDLVREIETGFMNYFPIVTDFS